MQRTEPMTFGEGIIGAAATGVITWLAASVTKVSKADHKELVQRVGALEKELTGRMTRTEFEQAFNKVEQRISEFRNEAKIEFKELRNELKSKT